MKTDDRLKNNYDIIKDLENKVYSSLFNNAPFPQMSIITAWLQESLLRKMNSNENSDKISFEHSILSAGIINTITSADEFYTTLFDENDQIPPNSRELRTTTPFTQALKEIYNTIEGIDNIGNQQDLYIYFELNKYLQHELGQLIGSNKSFVKVRDWIKTSTATHGLWDFQTSWISNVAIELIHNNIDELLFIDPANKLHDLANLINYRGDNKKQYSESYEKNIIELKKEGDWNFVWEATDKSDMLSLKHDLILKKQFILRLNIKYWISWMDNLNWPLLQDNAFNIIKDLNTFEEIIAFIAKDNGELKTKPEYLLLIALQNYYELIEKITHNLFHLKQGQWDDYNKGYKQKIITDAETKYDNWINLELEASCVRVFDLIFSSLPASQSKHFIGVFEWINNYSKQNYAERPNSEPNLLVLNAINKAFENKLFTDPGSKTKISKEISLKKLNWQAFEKLVTLFQNDETDNTFKDSLYQKYTQHIASDDFSWNLQLTYNNIVINQACNLSYLISKHSDPIKEWDNLYLNYKCWHEGWITLNSYDYKVRRKEYYVLMVGACLSYVFYEQSKTLEAKDVFDKVLDIVLSQYRVSTSLDSKEYEIILRVLTHIVARFTPLEINDHIKLIERKCDDIELFLVLMYEISLLNEKNALKLDVSAAAIKNQIDRHFWKIDNRYKEPVLKHNLNYFIELKKAILDNLNSIK